MDLPSTSDAPRRRPFVDRFRDMLVGAILVGMVLWHARDALSPGSLWLDDAWAALVVRADSVGEALTTTLTAPGWTLSLHGWLSLVGFTEFTAQVPALVAAILAVVVTWMATRRLLPTTNRTALAALVVATSPLLITYSTRVKPYTLDVLLSAALLHLATRTVEGSSGRMSRVWQLTAGALAALLLTAAVAPVAAGLVAMVAVQSWRGRADGTTWWAPPAAFFCGAGLFYVAVLSRTIPDGLTVFWQSRFLDVTDPSEWIRRFGEGGRAALETLVALPWPVALIVTAMGAAWATVAVLSAHREREQGGMAREGNLAEITLAVIVVPWLGSLVLAVLGLAPWGGGRTDSALLVSSAVAIAMFRVPGQHRTLRTVGPHLVVAALLVHGVTAARYPIEDVHAVMTRQALAEQPADITVVYSASRWAWALYTTDEIDVVSDADEANGFLPVTTADDVTLLRTVGDGGEADLQAVLAHAPPRVWLLWSHGRDEHLAVLEQTFRREGYTPGESIRGAGARADVWVRAS